MARRDLSFLDLLVSVTAKTRRHLTTWGVQLEQLSMAPRCPFLSVRAGCAVATSTARHFTIDVFERNTSKLSFIRLSAAACVSESAGKVITFSGRLVRQPRSHFIFKLGSRFMHSSYRLWSYSWAILLAFNFSLGCKGPAELNDLALVSAPNSDTKPTTDKTDAVPAETAPESGEFSKEADVPSTEVDSESSEVRAGESQANPTAEPEDSPSDAVMNEKTEVASASDSPAKINGVSTLPAQPRASLSAPARRLKQLIDEGKWSAATTLVSTYLQQYPDDGGVHAMHGRILLYHEDTLHDFIPADSQTERVLQAFRNAVEFDSGLNAMVADILLRHAHTLLSDAVAKSTPATFIDLYLLAEQDFQANQRQLENSGDYGDLGKLAETMQLTGIVTIGNFIAAERGNLYYAGGWDLGIVLARQCDPRQAELWAPHFAKLGPQFAAANLYGSAMYMRSAATWLAGITDKKARTLECLTALVGETEKISQDQSLRRRADIALGQFIKAGWETEVKQLVDERNPEVMQVFRAIAN
jgi:hypothetical protein